MKDVITILIILAVLYGGYKGLTLMADYAGPETTTVVEEAALESERINQSAFEEMKASESEELAEAVPKNVPKEKTQPNTPEKTKGEQAMEAVRGKRADAEGNLRSKEEFYKEPTYDEKRPYERKNTTPPRPSSNDKDLKDQQTALAQKGKALEGEFTEKGAAVEKEIFNIETGKKEKVLTKKPRSYNANAKYLLVVGSFSSADNARKEVNRYYKKGYRDARLVVSDKNMNLVTLGRYDSSTKARKRAAQIKRKGIEVYVKTMR